MSELPERIVPRRRVSSDPPPAKLAATLLSVATAGLVEPSRFRRGKEYAASSAVVELLVGPRRLGATVQGSRREAYRVEIAVDAAARPADLGDVPRREHLVQLSPQSDELVSSCTCPDGHQPCKHVAAALLCFADEIAWRPELLVLWRCGESAGSTAPRARAGSRADRLRTLQPSGRPVAPTSPFATPEWREFLAAPAPLPTLDVPVELLPLGQARLGPFDVAAWVRSAQRAVQPGSIP